MNRPWFPFYTRDWLDNKELARCRPESRALLVGLMCLAHEGDRYGYLIDSIGPLTPAFIAARVGMTLTRFQSSLSDLLENHRLEQDETGFFIPRMVADEEIRLKRAAGGKLGGNPSLKVGLEVNLTPNLTPATEGYPHSRAQARADYGSVSASESVFEKPKENNLAKNGDWPNARAFLDAWTRHNKHRRDQPMQVVAQTLIGRNGTVDWHRLIEVHPAYCLYWDKHDWTKNPLTLLEWIDCGMPVPPQTKSDDIWEGIAP